MEVNIHKNKKADILRRFFKENYKELSAGAILFIATLSSWFYWKNYHSVDLTTISQSYQEISKRFATAHLDDVTVAEAFIQLNSNIYGVLGALQLAKYFVEHNDFTKAEQQLIRAQTQSKDVNLLSEINLRLARVQLQGKKWDDALKTLDAIQGEGWTAVVQCTYGDIFLDKGDIKNARAAYNKSLNSDTSQALQVLLRIKLNNLSD